MKRKRKVFLVLLLVLALLGTTNLGYAALFATQDDGTTHYYGCEVPTEEELAEYPVLETSSLEPQAGAPAAMNLMPSDFPIGNQGQQGSCTAWAVGYANKSFQEQQDYLWDFSLTEHLFSPTYIYNQINHGQDNGSSIADAMNLLVNQGVCPLASMPYGQWDYTTQPSPAQRAAAAPFKAASWAMLQRGNLTNGIKQQLLSGNMVVLQIPVYPDFDTLNGSSNRVYDYAGGARRGYHAVCITGYDDTLNAFRIANSWGTNWGSGGYGYIAYGLVSYFDNTSESYGYVMTDKKDAAFATSAKGGNAFPTANSWFLPTTTISRVWPADLDGDGKEDLAGIANDGTVYWAKSQGSGSFSNMTLFGSTPFSAPNGWLDPGSHQRVWMTDINGDKKADMVGVAANGTIYTMVNNGGSWGALTASGSAFPAANSWFLPTTTISRVWPADLDGDGKMDLAGLANDGIVYWARSQGNGNFSNMTTFGSATPFSAYNGWLDPNFQQRVWLTDINGDKKADMVGVAANGTIYTMVNNGGSWGTLTASGNAFPASSSWFTKAYQPLVWPADINGDGNIDIVGLDVIGNVYWAKSQGNGRFDNMAGVPANATSPFYGWYSPASNKRAWPADINGDGKVDFVGIAISPDGAIYSALNNMSGF